VRSLLRPLAAVAALTLLADSPVPFRGPRPPTVVSAGETRAPVVAVSASARLRAPAARTAVVVVVNAGSGAAETAARVTAVRDAVHAAAPQGETTTRTFETTALAGQIGPGVLGGRVAVVVPGPAAAAARLVADAIRPFAFARILGVENEPADCAAAQAAADANARAAGRALAAAGAAALGWDLGEPTLSEDRTVPGNSLESSMLCRGADAIVTYPLDGGAAADDRSSLRATFALAFSAAAKRSLPASDAERDIDSEPALPRWFPRDVALVTRQRAITFVGTASAPVAYAGDLVTSASRTNDDALRDRVRALGLTDVRTLVTGDGESLLAVRVPRDGPVKADEVVRVMRGAAGERTRSVGSTPYADCAARDAQLVAAAVHDARRRAEVVAGALHVVFAAPAALLVSEPVSYAGCTSSDAPAHREYTAAVRFLSGAPDRNVTRTVVVAVTFPLQPATPLGPGAPGPGPLRDDTDNGRLPDDLTPPVRPALAREVATTTASQALDARRVDLEIGDGPDAANAFRAVDPAAVELAVAPWIAGAGVERTHVTAQPRWTPSEHDDIAIGFRLDRVPPGFADQARVKDAVARLGALGYPTVQYVPRAAACRAAGDAATVDAVRRALAGGSAPPSAIVVGGAVVRHGACGDGFGNRANAWWNQAVDTTVRIDVTARVFR
jgi:hypothetical protein